MDTPPSLWSETPEPVAFTNPRDGQNQLTQIEDIVADFVRFWHRGLMDYRADDFRQWLATQHVKLQVLALQAGMQSQAREAEYPSLLPVDPIP